MNQREYHLRNIAIQQEAIRVVIINGAYSADFARDEDQAASLLERDAVDDEIAVRPLLSLSLLEVLVDGYNIVKVERVVVAQFFQDFASFFVRILLGGLEDQVLATKIESGAIHLITYIQD